MENQIKVVNVEKIYALRQKVLRPNGDIESVKFAGDFDKTTLHFALLVSGVICGCASLYEASSKHFLHQNQFQLRGMAVEETYRSHGFGNALIAFAEQTTAKLNGKLLWLNARDYAVGFYEKNGYKCIGDYFDIPNVCKHIVMYKEIQNGGQK